MFAGSYCELLNYINKGYGIDAGKSDFGVQSIFFLSNTYTVIFGGYCMQSDLTDVSTKIWPILKPKSNVHIYTVNFGVHVFSKIRCTDTC